MCGKIPFLHAPSNNRHDQARFYEGTSCENGASVGDHDNTAWENQIFGTSMTSRPTLCGHGLAGSLEGVRASDAVKLDLRDEGPGRLFLRKPPQFVIY